MTLNLDTSTHGNQQQQGSEHRAGKGTEKTVCKSQVHAVQEHRKAKKQPRQTEENRCLG